MGKKKPTDDKNAIFTHNCGARIVCGRLEAVPAMMAFHNTLPTTIDGAHKGAGMTKMQGEISRVQYYFEQQSWINNVYFRQRGLNQLGYVDGQNADASDDVELSGTITLDNSNSKTVIDFDGEHAEIEKRQDQKFEEL